MKCPRYCEDEKVRKWNLGETNCKGDHEHCGNVITFGSQKYCGYVPARCTIWQTVRSQARCWFCVYSTKKLDFGVCSDCLSKPTRVFKKYDEYWVEKCKREGISIESMEK